MSSAASNDVIIQFVYTIGLGSPLSGVKISATPTLGAQDLTSGTRSMENQPWIRICFRPGFLVGKHTSFLFAKPFIQFWDRQRLDT